MFQFHTATTSDSIAELNKNRELKVSDATQFNEETWTNLCRAIAQSRAHTINLAESNLTDQQLAELCSALHRHKYIRKLILNENRKLTYKAETSLANLLYINKHIIALDIRGITLGELGLEPLLKEINRSTLASSSPNELL